MFRIERQKYVRVFLSYLMSVLICICNVYVDREMDWSCTGWCQGKEQWNGPGKALLHLWGKPRHLCTPVSGRLCVSGL